LDGRKGWLRTCICGYKVMSEGGAHIGTLSNMLPATKGQLIDCEMAELAAGGWVAAAIGSTSRPRVP